MVHMFLFFFLSWDSATADVYLMPRSSMVHLVLTNNGNDPRVKTTDKFKDGVDFMILRVKTSAL